MLWFLSLYISLICLACKKKKMKSYTMNSFVSSIFHSTCFWNSFILCVSELVFHCIILHRLFICSSTDEYLGLYFFWGGLYLSFSYYEERCCAHLWTNFVWAKISFPLGKYLKVELLGHVISVCLNSYETASFQKWLYLFNPNKQCMLFYILTSIWWCRFLKL